MKTDDSIFTELYQAALDEDWDHLKKFLQGKNNFAALKVPVSAVGDTLFHLAVFSNKDEPLKTLLEIAEKNRDTEDAFYQRNQYGNSALHEAAANGNDEAVKLLVKYYMKVNTKNTEFLEDTNDVGETPLFKAAAYGKTKVVKFLATKELGQLIEGTEYDFVETETEVKRVEKTYQKLKDSHRQLKKTINREPKPDTSTSTVHNSDGASILHAAIRGGYFETALLLLKLDERLANLKDKEGRTSLHLLATMPSAFKSGYRMDNLISRLFYFCVPIDDYEKEEKGSCFNLFKGWWILGKFCSSARKICQAKRKHKLAFKLAKSLIRHDRSWIEHVRPPGNIPAGAPIKEESKQSPLIMATERGIIKIVKEMLKVRPQLVEPEMGLKQNILHVAIKYRQKKIFDHVKKMKIPMTRLVRGIDNNGYTILHHAAYLDKENIEIHPEGPVYQLQEELKWYKRVEDIMPPHYANLRVANGDCTNLTCKELFKKKHNELLKNAQKWMKETSQSCSAVAVLVATVVFAAAYTVPGGSNDKGYPVFLNNNFFLIFTVMDVIALACSLTSVVMFLSILTSPFSYEQFLHALPRKLSIGFSLLFVALTTTMLAFAATLLLIVRFQKPRWTTTLIYSAAFLPVSIFALTQFPMYFAFKVTLLKFYKWIKNALPRKRFKSRLPIKFGCSISMNCVLSKKNDDHRPRPPV